VSINQSFSYDGITSDFTSAGGLNFVAYLKPDYDEFRNPEGSSWGNASTGLNPSYSVQGTTAHMEVAIPWYAITKANGIPDSLKLVLFQGNGNAGSPFVYGQAPAGITGGATSTVIASETIRKVIATPLTEENPFDFGNVTAGNAIDTTFLLYNKGTSSISAITPFSSSNPEISPITDPATDLEPKIFSRFKVRFFPNSVGNQVAVASTNYSAGTVNQDYSFKILGNGVSGPVPDIRIRIGNTVAISGDSLLFGILDFGNQKDSTVWVFNSGTDTLRINSAILSGSAYSFVNSIPVKLAPGDSVGARIRFSSSAPAGVKQGKLTLGINVPGLSTFVLNIKGTATVPVLPPSTLLIQQMANNLINTSGAIPESQLQPRFLLSDDQGIKWYAAWDTAHLYVVKIGGNRAQPQILYMRASYPGAVFTDTPTFYDGFHPNFTGMGGINFSAYLKESSIPYDEFRNWNGTLWLAPDPSLQPLYGNQGTDIFAVRIPWDNITQSNGIPDSVRLVLYQTTGSLANFSAYGQSPVGLPSGNTVTPPVNLFHSFNIVTRLPRESEFDFGNVELGKSVDTCFLFRNIGPDGSQITINGPSTISGSSYTAVLQPTTGTILGSEKYSVLKVRFTPTTLGQAIGSFTANASFDNPASPYVVHFKGNGIPAATPGIQVKLGSVLVSSGSTSSIGIAEIGTPLDTAFRIINTGQDTLRLSNVGNVSPDWEIATAPSLKIRPGDSTRLVFRKPVTTAGVNFGQFSFSTNVTGSTNIQLAVLFQGDSVLSWFPPVPTINDSITITYKQGLGNKALKDISPVFVHTGVITSGPTGTNWENVQGTFNIPADSVKLLDLGQNRQQIKFRIRDFYNLTGNPTVHRLGMVFRNGDGSKVGKTRTEGDFFIPVNPNPATAQIRVRTSGGASLSNGDTIQFGLLPYGSVRDTTVWLKNTGAVPLVFSLINVASFSFSQIGTTTETLAVGDSAKVDIRLDVNGNGPLEGFLNLVSNASNSPTLLIYLTAQGVVSNRDLLSENSLQVYPNPTSGKLNIEIEGELPVSSFQFTDLTGRIALEGKRKAGDQLDISSLPSGIWILTIESRSGKIRRKVVKE
ncbi:MAG TPA: choice-of-anchor D domain-containing protein, partial [Catalimonadaceae bacterium]|nr:choice-of-anchor D domain-containing protein [Catalimonadaceae bacterium]